MGEREDLGSEKQNLKKREMGEKGEGRERGKEREGRGRGGKGGEKKKET